MSLCDSCAARAAEAELDRAQQEIQRLGQCLQKAETELEEARLVRHERERYARRVVELSSRVNELECTKGGATC